MSCAGLEVLIPDRPATLQIFDAILAVWPDHRRYLERGIIARTIDEADTAEHLAKAVLVIGGERLAELAENYRWTCDRLGEEELFFHREGHYRLATFAEAEAEVYGNHDYMARYVDGLLLSQVVWYNHIASCNYFRRTAPGIILPGARMLEIGPGHGLMTWLADRYFALSSVKAWDISEVSVAQTRHALDRLGAAHVECAVRDVLCVSAADGQFDFVVLSEVLEHLEDPAAVMTGLKRILAPHGVVFVNVPINSPSPDHLYLMRTPDEARDLLWQSGFMIEDERLFATQGMKLERALRSAVTVSVCMFARLN